MRRILQYITVVYYILAPLPLVSIIVGWFILMSIEGIAVAWAAATIILWIQVFSAVVVVVGIVLLILLKWAKMPVGRVKIALLAAAVPLVGLFIFLVVL